METGMNRNIISILVICLLIFSMVQAVGAASSDSITVSGYILPHQAPNADFTASPRSGSAPLTVNFTDTSSESPSDWAWDFQNDGIVDSHAQNPSYTYSYPGTYSVKLRVTNTFGSDSEIKSAYISVTSGGPMVRISGLKTYINGLTITEWSKWLLLTQLGQVEKSIEKGNDHTAEVHMSNFMERVRILLWLRMVSETEANYMISEANSIIVLIRA